MGWCFLKRSVYLIHSNETQLIQFHISKQQISPSHVSKLGFFVRARISWQGFWRRDVFLELPILGYVINSNLPLNHHKVPWNPYKVYPTPPTLHRGNPRHIWSKFPGIPYPSSCSDGKEKLFPEASWDDIPTPKTTMANWKISPHFSIGNTSTHSWWIFKPAMLVFWGECWLARWTYTYIIIYIYRYQWDNSNEGWPLRQYPHTPYGQAGRSCLPRRARKNPLKR